MIAERCSASHPDKAQLSYIWSISHASVDRYGPHHTWLDMEGLKEQTFQANWYGGNIASNRERCTSHPIARVIDTIHAVRDIIVHLQSFALDYPTLGSKHYVSA